MVVWSITPTQLEPTVGTIILVVRKMIFREIDYKTAKTLYMDSAGV